MSLSRLTPFLLDLWCSDRNVLVIVRQNKSTCGVCCVIAGSLTSDPDLVGQRIVLTDASAHLQYRTCRHTTPREEGKIRCIKLTRNAPAGNVIDNIVRRLAYILQFADE